MKALLALEDGTVFEGKNFGAKGEAYGEVVFNTSMTGYQEILTDPSYAGQIVTMTYPHIGNYGINFHDFESKGPCLRGFVVKEASKIYSNWQASESLQEFLKKYQIVGIEDIDTRALTKRIRTVGAMKGVISTVDLNPRRLVEKAKESPGLIGRDLVQEVTGKKPFYWENQDGKYHVVAFDFGIKHHILRSLKKRNCQIKVVPAKTKAKEVLRENPDGILLSNGPGDPEGVPYAIDTVRKLLGKKPIFGICLGHQLLALALGGKTYKLKFGHHGGNQPVKNLRTGKVEITAQNHGFAVDENSLGKAVEITHLNLNDNTVEGIYCYDIPAFSVQYHPEASPGPHDSRYLFDNFMDMMKGAG